MLLNRNASAAILISMNTAKRKESAASLRARYAGFTAKVRKEADRILLAENIPGGFRLFQRATAMNSASGWSRKFLGKYSTRSFGWTGAPNISINPSYIHAYCKQRNAGIDPDWDDAADPSRIAVDTVLHEFGHGIWDLLGEEDADLLGKASAEFCGDEEEFAEEFLQYLRGSFTHADFFIEFLDGYRQAYDRLATECAAVETVAR